MAKFKFKLKKTWKNVLTVGMAIMLFIGAIMGITSLVQKADEDTKTISLSYDVGGLNKVGAYEKREDCIYTKDAFECQGLKITPDFDGQVSYQVFFYDANGQYLECSEVLTDVYEGTPLLAAYARIMIFPDGDDKISWYEVGKYARTLTVDIDKIQHSFSVNLFEGDSAMIGMYYADDLSTFVDDADMSCSKIVDVRNYEKIVVKVLNSATSEYFLLQFFDENDVALNYRPYYVTSTGLYGIASYDIPPEAESFCLAFNRFHPNAYEFYCY